MAKAKTQTAKTAKTAKQANVKQKVKSTLAKAKKAPAKTASSKAKKSAAKSGKVNPNYGNLENLIQDIRSLMNDFESATGFKTALSELERRRLKGVATRTYGFIDKCFDIAIDNPSLVPSFVNIQQCADNLRQLEQLRQITLELGNFFQLASDCLLVESNSLYDEALSIYGNIKEMAKRRIPEAQKPYAALKGFFKRTSRNIDKEPTMKQLNKDIRALEKGKADGRIVIENISPKTTGGVHKIVDEVSRGKRIVKESEEFAEKE